MDLLNVANHVNNAVKKITDLSGQILPGRDGNTEPENPLVQNNNNENPESRTRSIMRRLPIPDFRSYFQRITQSERHSRFQNFIRTNHVGTAWVYLKHLIRLNSHLAIYKNLPLLDKEQELKLRQYIEYNDYVNLYDEQSYLFILKLFDIEALNLIGSARYIIEFQIGGTYTRYLLKGSGSIRKCLLKETGTKGMLFETESRFIHKDCTRGFTDEPTLEWRGSKKGLQTENLIVRVWRSVTPLTYYLAGQGEQNLMDIAFGHCNQKITITNAINEIIMEVSFVLMFEVLCSYQLNLSDIQFTPAADMTSTRNVNENQSSHYSMFDQSISSVGVSEAAEPLKTPAVPSTTVNQIDRSKMLARLNRTRERSDANANDFANDEVFAARPDDHPAEQVDIYGFNLNLICYYKPSQNTGFKNIPITFNLINDLVFENDEDVVQGKLSGKQRDKGARSRTNNASDAPSEVDAIESKLSCLTETLDDDVLYNSTEYNEFMSTASFNQLYKSIAIIKDLCFSYCPSNVNCFPLTMTQYTATYSELLYTNVYIELQKQSPLTGFRTVATGRVMFDFESADCVQTFKNISLIKPNGDEYGKLSCKVRALGRPRLHQLDSQAHGPSSRIFYLSAKIKTITIPSIEDSLYCYSFKLVNSETKKTVSTFIGDVSCVAAFKLFGYIEEMFVDDIYYWRRFLHQLGQIKNRSKLQSLVNTLEFDVASCTKFFKEIKKLVVYIDIFRPLYQLKLDSVKMQSSIFYPLTFVGWTEISFSELLCKFYTGNSQTFMQDCVLNMAGTNTPNHNYKFTLLISGVNMPSFPDEVIAGIKRNVNPTKSITNKFNTNNNNLIFFGTTIRGTSHYLCEFLRLRDPANFVTLCTAAMSLEKSQLYESARCIHIVEHGHNILYDPYVVARTGCGSLIDICFYLVALGHQLHRRMYVVSGLLRQNKNAVWCTLEITEKGRLLWYFPSRQALYVTRNESKIKDTVVNIGDNQDGNNSVKSSADAEMKMLRELNKRYNSARFFKLKIEYVKFITLIDTIELLVDPSNVYTTKKLITHKTFDKALPKNSTDPLDYEYFCPVVQDTTDDRNAALPMTCDYNDLKTSVNGVISQHQGFLDYLSTCLTNRILEKVYTSLCVSQIEHVSSFLAYIINLCHNHKESVAQAAIDSFIPQTFDSMNDFERKIRSKFEGKEFFCTRYKLYFVQTTILDVEHLHNVLLTKLRDASILKIDIVFRIYSTVFGYKILMAILFESDVSSYQLQQTFTKNKLLQDGVIFRKAIDDNTVNISYEKDETTFEKVTNSLLASSQLTTLFNFNTDDSENLFGTGELETEVRKADSTEDHFDLIKNTSDNSKMIINKLQELFCNVNEGYESNISKTDKSSECEFDSIQDSDSSYQENFDAADVIMAANSSPSDSVESLNLDEVEQQKESDDIFN